MMFRKMMASTTSTKITMAPPLIHEVNSSDINLIITVNAEDIPIADGSLAYDNVMHGASRQRQEQSDTNTVMSELTITSAPGSKQDSYETNREECNDGEILAREEVTILQSSQVHARTPPAEIVALCDILSQKSPDDIVVVHEAYHDDDLDSYKPVPHGEYPMEVLGNSRYAVADSSMQNQGSFVRHPQDKSSQDSILSFQPSQMGSSELEELGQLISVPADKNDSGNMVDEANQHNTEIFEQVGRHIQGIDEDNLTNPRTTAKTWCRAAWLVGLGFILMLATILRTPSRVGTVSKDGSDYVTPWVNESTSHQKQIYEEPTQKVTLKMLYTEGENNNSVQNTKNVVQETNVFESWWQRIQSAWWQRIQTAWWQLKKAIIGIVVLMLLSKGPSARPTSPTSPSLTAPSEKAVTKEAKCEELSSPRLSMYACRKKEEGKSNLDVSRYEMLRVVELRELLRSRGSKTCGKKPVLVQRLVNIYTAELETLTVRELRPMLRARGCRQAGLKSELIQRLVEAGMQT